MSELEQRFETWWRDEGCVLFIDCLDEDKAACRTAWMNGAYVQKHSTKDKADAEHLEWIYARMIYKHGENPLVDYISKFKQIIDKRYSTKEQG